MNGTHGGQTFLVVDDHASITRAWSRQLGALGAVALTAYSVAEGKQVIERAKTIDGAVLDHMLPDGRGLDLVEPLRSRFPLASIAIVTGAEVEEHFANEVLGCGALYGRKPLTSDGFMALFERARLTRELRDAGTASLEALIDRYGLSPAERETLIAQLSCDSRADAARLLGVKDDTVKSHTRALLKKTGHKSLRGLMRQMLEQVNTSAVLRT